MTTLLLVLLLLAFICGAELFAIMLLAAGIGALTLAVDGRLFDEQYYGMFVSMFGVGTGDQATVLSTIPMFIYAGYVLAEAGTADRLVRCANAWVGWFPGGLAIVTIGTCAVFTTFTGASGVTIVALGGVLLPALVKNGYPQKFSLGMLAGTGSVGLLFPPALPLFIYGTIYGLQLVGDPEAAANWDTMRFAFAGIVPGIVLLTALSLVAIWVARKLPRQKFDLKEAIDALVKALPELAIPPGVLLLVGTGTFSLPEAAALTVVYVVLLEAAALRTVKPVTLWNVSREAMVMVGAIFAIILCSSVFTNYLVTATIPDKLVDWAAQYVHSKLLFLLVLNLLLLVVGMLMDIFSAIVIVLPLIVPISRHYGIDPYHLGVIFLLNLEVGYLTPPVGLNLFITSLKFKVPVVDVMRATGPFLVTMIVVLGIVTYVPALTIVPAAARRDPVNNLKLLVEDGIDEIKVSKTQIELVDSEGKPLTGPDGKPVVRKFKDCAFITDAAGTYVKDDKTGKPQVADITRRTTCQELFFDFTDCGPKETKDEPTQKACTQRAIAKWVVGRYNEAYPAAAFVVVDKVALTDAEGEPLTYEADVVGPDGKPVVDELGTPQKEQKPLLGPDGKPIERTLAWCDQLEFASDREKCRALFVAVSGCKINPYGQCLEDKCPREGDGDPAGDPVKQAAERTKCVRAAVTDCEPVPYDECRAELTTTWVEDNPSIARNPKLKGAP